MITFKQAQQSDIENIGAMMGTFYAIDQYPFDYELALSMLQDFIADENLGKIWLIYDDKNLAGYVVLTFIFSFEHGGRIAFVDELFISTPFRGRGTGRHAIDFIKQQAGKLLLKVLYLEIEPHNRIAQKLYIAADFEPHSRNLMRYKP